jgi:deoxyribodipyrimidine photo-lyase
MNPAIVWFRRNLRLRDNEALLAAVGSGQPLIPLYVADSTEIGGASRWWLHHSLAALDSALAGHGRGLVIMAGTAADAIGSIVRETGANRLYYSRRYEPASRLEEDHIASQHGDGIDIEAFDDGLLNHPNAVMTGGGTPYKVYTPYHRAASGLGEPAKPQRAPDAIRFADNDLPSLKLTDLALLPEAPDWAGGLREAWRPGEDGALARLDAVDEIVNGYAGDRDRPDLDATTRLSPHLHFGEISVRQAWHAIRRAEVRAHASRGAEALLRQLYWREFSAYLLYHFPEIPAKPLRDEFRQFPWIDDDELLGAWQRGQTGYPIVDAGMRQLWATGWMHNRVRMIVASFLVKDLMVPWQRGADWFLDTLVDADLANNSASWQWVAGCGTDAAPYFRIFNPTLQGKKFDPAGDYVRRWVPELAGLSAAHIHEPWLAKAGLLETAGIRPGRDYPAPLVDHGDARKRALEAYQAMRAAA